MANSPLDLVLPPTKIPTQNNMKNKILPLTLAMIGCLALSASAAILSSRDGAGGREASPRSSRRSGLTRRLVATKSREIGRFQNRVKVPSDYVPLPGSEPIPPSIV